MFTVNDVVEVSVVCGNVAFWRTVSYGSERDFIVVHFPCRYGQRAEAEKQLVPAQTGKSNLIDNLARYRHHFPVVTAYFFFLPSLPASLPSRMPSISFFFFVSIIVCYSILWMRGRIDADAPQWLIAKIAKTMLQWREKEREMGGGRGKEPN